jgi:carboxypeptidase T
MNNQSKIDEENYKHMNKFRFLVITLLVLGAIGFLGGLLLSSNKPTVASDSPTTGLVLEETDQPEVIRFYFNSRAELDAVSGELDIWEVHHDLGYAVAAVSFAQKQWLELSGYRVEVDAEKTAQLQAPTAALDPRFRYFDDFYTNTNGLYMVNKLQEVNTNYPNITELIDIGDAWTGEVGGGYNRDIWVLRITNEDPAYGDIADKPPFFLFANIHAREVTTPEMAMRYIQYMTSGYNDVGGYNINADVTWLVNHNVLYVLVSENPDGHVINEQNINNYWRKNVDNDDGCPYSSSWGVDLNRNSSFFWGCCGGSSGNPCDELYRGPSSASEPEVYYFQNYFSQIFQDQNGDNGDNEYPPAAPDNTTGIFITLHTYSDLVLWPWGHTNTPAPNSTQLRTIGRKFAYYNGATPQQAYQLYATDGTTDDWTYGKFGVPSYTFEIGPGYGICGDFFPSYDCMEGTNGAPRNFWAENLPAFLFAHKIARTPYMTAYGPDTQNLMVDPYSVVRGLPLNLSGNIQDHRSNGDTPKAIAAAEYFIDAPGEDGTGISMLPVDGDWGDMSEDVQAEVDTLLLSEGKHYILVHGQNVEGKWGPFTAIFFNIELPEYMALLSPDMNFGQADPGSVYTYTLQLTNIGTLSDTYALSADSNWPIVLPASIGPLENMESASFDVVVSVPVTATNGETDAAMVTVTGTGNVVTSVLTTTANFYDPNLAPVSQEGQGYPGLDVVYTFQVENNGNFTDTFDVTASGIWTTTAPASIGPLASGESANLVVTVTVPLTALPGDADTSIVTITSQGDPAQVRTATLTTTSLRRGPDAAPLDGFDSASIDPGSMVTYTIVVTNIGDVADTYSITVQAEWETQAPTSTISLNPGESTTVDVIVKAPADAKAGASDTATITFSSAKPATYPASVELVTIVNTIYGLTTQVDTLVQSGRPGQIVTYTLQVFNTGNITDTFDITVTNTWGVEFSAPVGPLAVGESAVVEIVITIPLEAVNGAEDVAEVTITSQGDASQMNLISLTTKTVWYSTFLPLTAKQ